MSVYGRQYRTLAKSHRSSSAVRLFRVAKVHELRCRSENTEVATGIHDPCHDAIAFHNFNGAIDRETFRDASKVNSQPATEEDAAILAKKNVSPCCGGIRSIALAGKIAPAGQSWRNRYTKCAVAFTSKLLRSIEYPPGPRVYNHALWKRLSIHM